MKNICYSTEVFTNYIQAATVSPDEKFEAIQTADGHSILFSINTEDQLILTEEVLGKGYGWVCNDISSTLFDLYPDANAISIKDFAVSQASDSGEFCLLAALTVDGNDHLYIADSYARIESTNNEDETPEETIRISWSEIPYDGDDTLDTLNISGIFLKDTKSYPLIIVDIEASNNFVGRYYIAAKNNTALNKKWIKASIPANFNPSTEEHPMIIASGRRYPDSVDGIYTLGYQPSGESIIMYQPLYIPGNLTETPGLTPLNISDNYQGNVQNMAVTQTYLTDPNAYGTFTDLYTTTDQGDLYLFRCDGQMSGEYAKDATFIMNNPLFADMEQMYALTSPDKVVIWGRNRSGKVFYTQCATENHQFYGEWTYPMEIASGVNHISPYTNIKNQGNTFFADMGSGLLKKVFQDPVSTIWQVQDINLPVSKDLPPQEYDSYTTKITIKDENNNVISGTYLELSSAYRVPVYIDNHYYVLDVSPIQIQTGGAGTMTINQAVTEELQGASLSIQVMQNTASDPDATPVLVKEGDAILINPMDKSTAQILELNSEESLTSATSTDDKGENPEALVPSDSTQEDIDATVAAINNLAESSNDLSTTSPEEIATKMTMKGRLSYIAHQRFYENHGAQPSYKQEDDGAVTVAAGDLFRRMRDMRQKRVQFRREVIKRVIETGEEIWEFICEVGDEIMKFVIDSVEKLVGAIQAVFEAIGTVIKGLIQFVKFLFSWDDIKMTADVFSTLTRVALNDAIWQLKSGKVKEGLGDLLDNIRDAVNNVLNYTPTEDPTETFDTMSSSSTTSTEDDSASDQYLQDHLVNNADQLTLSQTEDENSALMNCLLELKELCEDLTDLLTTSITDFYDQILKDFAFRDMTIWEVLSTSLGLLANLIIDGTEAVLDTLIDLFTIVVDNIWDALNTPMHIPILSPILEKFFDIELPSLLDSIILVMAMPATMGYKVLRFESPFRSGDGFTDDLLALNVNPTNAQEATAAMTQISTIMSRTPSSKNSGAMAKESEAKLTPPQKALFICGTMLSSGNDCTSSALTVLCNIPGGERLDSLKAISKINNLVRILADHVVGIFANPCPVPDTPDDQYHALNVTSEALSVLNLLEKSASFYILNHVERAEKYTVSMIDSVSRALLSTAGAAVSGWKISALIREEDPGAPSTIVGYMQGGVSLMGAGASCLDVPLTAIPDGSKSAVVITSKTIIAALGSACYLTNFTFKIGECITEVFD